jgi:hypothetical protein
MHVLWLNHGVSCNASPALVPLLHRLNIMCVLPDILLLTPCTGTYPANDYSNKRWCCGDMEHFDVSVWAYEKLSDVKWGVIGIKYRAGELLLPAVLNTWSFWFSGRRG